jgi:hypothetical protein
MAKCRESLVKGSGSTDDLLVLTSSDQLLFKLKLFHFLYKNNLFYWGGQLYRAFPTLGKTGMDKCRESLMKGSNQYRWPPVLSSSDQLLFTLKLYIHIFFSFLRTNLSLRGGQLYCAFSKVSLARGIWLFIALLKRNMCENLSRFHALLIKCWNIFHCLFFHLKTKLLPLL